LRFRGGGYVERASDQRALGRPCPTAAAATLEQALGGQNVTLVPEYKPGASASEDYSEYVLAGMTRSVFFNIGGGDPATIERYKAEGKPLPVNHSPYFAPVPEPTIRTGVRTLTLAVLMVMGL
jgi:hippurate hydrolase